MAHQVWFRSSQFQIESGEDEETNPKCFGRQFANWLRNELLLEGRPVEDVIPEDWGWCIVVQRKPFLLWLGCVNVHDFNTPLEVCVESSDIVWTCNVVAEQSIIARLFHRIDTSFAVDELFQQARKIIASNQLNILVPEP